MDYISSLHGQRAKGGHVITVNNLLTNDMLKIMFPNLHTLVIVYMTLPVGTVTVERSFSQMKMVKTRLKNRLGEKSTSY